MKIVQIQDLQDQEIQSIGNHQLLFHGHLFRLGPKISKKLEKAALEYCQVCCRAGQACLLQEDDSYWTVWKRVSKAKPAVVAHPFPLQQGNLSAQFIDRCKRELLDCIGPIADLVLEQTLSEVGMSNIEPQKFIAALSQKIPSPSLASTFHNQCRIAEDAEVKAARVRTLKIASPASRAEFNQSREARSPVSI